MDTYLLCNHVVTLKPGFHFLGKCREPITGFLQMITYLKSVLKGIPSEQWSNFGLAYDNMYHLNDLKAARVKLPSDEFPAPFDEMWLRITKIIDGLHIRNHKQDCQVKYAPEKLRKLHPDCSLNKMATEQTFVWLSQFKKLLCAMPKLHHHFFLYCMVSRRNQYTDWCHSEGRLLVLPKFHPQ